ncbi:hypothetical protein V1511DRAFT_493082 [Dipodascopsis uninucleata]
MDERAQRALRRQQNSNGTTTEDEFTARIDSTANINHSNDSNNKNGKAERENLVTTSVQSNKTRGSSSRVSSPLSSPPVVPASPSIRTNSGVLCFICGENKEQPTVECSTCRSFRVHANCSRADVWMCPNCLNTRSRASRSLRSREVDDSILNRVSNSANELNPKSRQHKIQLQSESSANIEERDSFEKESFDGAVKYHTRNSEGSKKIKSNQRSRSSQEPEVKQLKPIQLRSSRRHAPKLLNNQQQHSIVSLQTSSSSNRHYQTQGVPRLRVRQPVNYGTIGSPSTTVSASNTVTRRRGRPRKYALDDPRSRSNKRHRVTLKSDSLFRLFSDDEDDYTVYDKENDRGNSYYSKTLADNFRSAKSKYIQFSKSSTSYLAKFNLAALASHVDIHVNNLAISGYMSFDQTYKYKYIYKTQNSDSERDEAERPYGGMLTAAQANTARTVPSVEDKMMFGKSLLLACHKERLDRKYQKFLPISSASIASSDSNIQTNSHYHSSDNSADEDEISDSWMLSTSSAPSVSTSPSVASESDAIGGTSDSESEGDIGSNMNSPANLGSKIQAIRFGTMEIKTWYTAPYPEEYSRRPIIYICEYCLKYMPTEYVYWRHQVKCQMRHPPGDEIYRSGRISVFEVDGRKNQLYCQNLCLLAKLFLGSKTLYYDVEPFLFYIMTEQREKDLLGGCHFIGYFSKEKRPSSAYNVSCILTLPIHQRKGYGNFLISFSYLLSRSENKEGTPEKPLSDLGLMSYRNYWKLTMAYVLRDLFINKAQEKSCSISEMSKRTGMTNDDVICGLEYLNAIVRDPNSGTYAIRVDTTLIQKVISDWESKGYITLEPENLIWSPVDVGRSGGINSLFYASIAALPNSSRLNSTITHDGAEETAEYEEVDELVSPQDFRIVPPQTLAGVSRPGLWTLDHRVDHLQTMLETPMTYAASRDDETVASIRATRSSRRRAQGEKDFSDTVISVRKNNSQNGRVAVVSYDEINESNESASISLTEDAPRRSNRLASAASDVVLASPSRRVLRPHH